MAAPPRRWTAPTSWRSTRRRGGRWGDAALLTMLHYMKLTRALEYRIERNLYRQGKIVGGVYVGRGQEAISVGAAMHIRRGGDESHDDIVSPSHRDMAVFLMQGFTPA